MLYSRSMGRIIAIDYGRKRTGIAATDILQMIANGVATVLIISHANPLNGL